MTPVAEKTDTKQKLIDAATQLMIEKGYTATSVEAICEAAKVTKGAFFHYFKSKEALAEEAIGCFSKQMSGSLGACCGQDKADPLERVFALIDATIEVTSNPGMKGCLVGTLTQEFEALELKLRKICADKFEAMRQMLKKDLTEAKKCHAPKAKFDPAALAELYVSVGQGAMLMAKAQQDRSVMKRTYSQYREYVEQLFRK